MKAVIATDVIFIIFMIGLIVGAALIIFWKWYASQSMMANQFACQMKLHNYCADVIQGKQTDWDSIPPTSGCDKFGIEGPPDKGDCEKL
jgi:hypothetical protein